jgi:hypothetical protein
MFPPLRIVKGKKRLCIPHADAFFGGEQIKWAPKRLLEWDLQQRMELAVKLEAIRLLQMEV